MPTISTGSKEIDDLLGGGIHTGMITDIYGQSGSGKSQFCFTLCANYARSSANILFIDTMGTFRPERIMEISASKMTLEKINYIRVFTTREQSNATKKIIELQSKLVVIDSLTSLFSTEYSGSERHRAIMKYMHELATLAINLPCAIVVTNMIRNAPPIALADPTGRNLAQAVVPWQQREFLGSSVSIYSHVKIKLEIVDSEKSLFQAVLVQPRGKEPVPFVIRPSGISDKH
ncbi:MAG TPA: ATPase domain-containing protein [Nitrososphaera sp.]|jgi:RecA/RadA recombinase|nr:ATPase domain-containing protein [Nitrososphaera sp.]